MKSQAGPMTTIQNDGTGFFDTWETTYTGAAYFFNTFDLNNDGMRDYYIPDDAIDRYGINTGNGPDGHADYVEYTAASSTDGFGSNSLITDMD